MSNEDTPSEEAISDDIQVKEQQETIKFLSEETRMLQQKHLKL